MNTLQSLASKIQDLQRELANLRSELYLMSNEVINLSSDVVGLSSDLIGVSSDISGLSSDLSGVVSTIDTIAPTAPNDNRYGYFSGNIPAAPYTPGVLLGVDNTKYGRIEIVGASAHSSNDIVSYIDLTDTPHDFHVRLAARRFNNKFEFFIEVVPTTGGSYRWVLTENGWTQG